MPNLLRMLAGATFGLVRIIRATCHITLFCFSPARPVIERDIDRWIHVRMWHQCHGIPKWRQLVWLIRLCPEFRNLFEHRVRHDGRSGAVVGLLATVAGMLFRPMDSLFIHTRSIGPGLYIQHGFSTIISARSIGENCWIYQQVTIGYTDVDKCPAIGNNVMVTAGAKVLGDITVGDNCTVGANAVVIKNVPANCTVVGVPAYIVKRDGVKTRQAL